MDEARGLIETVASEFTSHFGREKVGALEITGNPERRHGAGRDRDRSATRRRSCSTATTTCSSSACMRTGRSRRRSSRPLSPVPPTSPSIDRAAAFGSLGPLGADVRSLDLGHVKSAVELHLRGGRRRRDSRHAALGAAPDAVDGRAERRARVRPGGGGVGGRLAGRDRHREEAAASRPRRLRRLRARDQHPARARRPGRGDARSRRSSSSFRPRAGRSSPASGPSTRSASPST